MYFAGKSKNKKLPIKSRFPWLFSVQWTHVVGASYSQSSWYAQISLLQALVPGIKASPLGIGQPKS